MLYMVIQQYIEWWTCNLSTHPRYIGDVEVVHKLCRCVIASFRLSGQGQVERCHIFT